MEKLKDAIGNYEDFVKQILQKTNELNIDIQNYPIDHICFRAKDIHEYERVKLKLLKYSKSYLENKHHGRKNSKFILIEPIEVVGYIIPLVELGIKKEGGKSGLEHIEMVVNNKYDDLRNLKIWSGIEDSGKFNQPIYFTFEDGSSIRFHKLSLEEVIKLEGNKFISINS